MRFALAVLLLSAICAPPALAGAWLRDHNTAFFALGTTVRGNMDMLPDYETSAYAEYGLLPWLTFGLDLNDVRAKAAHALVFARLPLRSGDRPTRYGIELAIGKHRWQDQWAQMYKVSLAVGRGFESRFGNGWMAAETAYEMRTGLSEPTYKLDAVFGMSTGWRIRPLIKLETAYVADKPLAWALTPGVMFDVGKSAWVIGIEGRSAEQKTLGLSFGLWRTF
jgi:hypothetical protein